MGSIKVVVQRPGEISHVIYINKEYFIGSGKNLSTPFGLIYSTVLMIAKDDAGQPVSLTPEQVQTARSWLLKHSM